MDFPLFYMDFVGNRMLMALIAVVHVMINHPLAVGAWPLIALIEWRAWKMKSEAWDNLAYRITFVLFIVTTTLGALTGVGIWLTAALIAPFGIGSLLRIFFWAWFTEWLVFVSEVVLVLVYYLTWQRWREGVWKRVHLGVGIVLSAFSWVTMALIVAILGFMMGTGDWSIHHGFFSAFFNPLYAPQLLFRTSFAMLTAGLMVWFLMFFFTKGAAEVRPQVIRFVSIWILAWTPFCLIGGLWYWGRVPATMAANVNVAVMTQRFMTHYSIFIVVISVVLGLVMLTALTGLIRPKLIPRYWLVVPFALGLFTLGYFERVREFIRKPFVVADYMYSNGVTTTELPIYQRDGILTYATYAAERNVTPTNQLQAGRDVYMLACSRCHTTNGLNNVRNKFRILYGDQPWDPDVMTSLIKTMHLTRTYMPPFPGNDAEIGALVTFIKDLQFNPHTLRGVQSIGIALPANGPVQ